MRKRMGALLWLSLACTVAAVESAHAGDPYCGAGSYVSSPCDAQSCYPSCQQQTRICYKLVWEDVKQQRWHTCSKPVTETVNQTFVKTIMTNQCETRQKCVPEQVTEMIPVEKCRQVPKTIMVKECYTVCKPVYEQCVREVACTCIKKCPETCFKECVSCVNKTVYDPHVCVSFHQVQKQVLEQHVREYSVQCCKPVCETVMKSVCCQVCKNVTETHVRSCCSTVCKTVMKCCEKDCVSYVCKPVVTMKCVNRKCKELCCETYCKPGKCITCWEQRCDCCFDPCSCKTNQCTRLVRVTRQLPPETCTRQVSKWKCWTEQVPCTSYVKECVHTKVPYQVPVTVQENVVRQVPYTTCRAAQGAYADGKGSFYECDGPDRKFVEGAICRKQIPCTTTRMVTTCETKHVPYTTCRCVRGAYVDAKAITGLGKGVNGCDLTNRNIFGFADDGAGRQFVEGAQIRNEQVYTTARTVQERIVNRVPCTVVKDVVETQVRKVPYTKCTMVQETRTREVPQTICETQRYTELQKVCKTVMKTQTYTVQVCVPRQVVETRPCQVTKWVKVAEPYFETVKRCRQVPVVVAADPPCSVACRPQACCQTVSCSSNCCPKTACSTNCCTASNCCTSSNCCTNSNCCTKSCCGSGCCEESCCLLARFRRWFSTATCCNTCSTSCQVTCPAPTCCDPCHENLLQRLFRNRFCCSNDCCATGCDTAVPKN